jgi:phospholipid/cholesterol/gamma-HCH transport system substrate-binding protein
VPSQKELKWSQLKVGLVAAVALAALVFLIFLMSSTTGGLFSHKINLISYFQSANGLKMGAPVTLDGVTIGNVTAVKIVPHHEPNSVEVVSRVGGQFLPALHTDSVVSIQQAGILGDSFVDISSTHASGPEPGDNATLNAANTPGIQDVIRTSQDSIQQATVVIHKLGVLVDTLNSGKGTAGMLLNDPEVAHKVVLTINNLHALSDQLANGKGTLGKLLNDDTIYERFSSTTQKLDHIVSEIDAGHGSAGKLLKDDSLYKNLNEAVANANKLLGDVNAGKGSLGKLAKDPAMANKVEESLTRLNEILKGINEGKGSLGQMFVNKSLYDNLDKTLHSTGDLISAIRKDPKTYLTIHVKVF